MAVTLNDKNLGVIWICGNTANGTVLSTGGDIAITSVMYDCALELERVEFWTERIEELYKVQNGIKEDSLDN